MWPCHECLVTMPPGVTWHYRMKIFLSNENIFTEWKYSIEWQYTSSNENMRSNENNFYRMKIIFIEWKYIFYRIKTFYEIKIYFYRMKMIFIQWKYIFIEWKWFLSNENNFYRMQICFYRMKMIFIEFCYISATILYWFSWLYSGFSKAGFSLRLCFKYCKQNPVQSSAVCELLSPSH